MIKKKPVAVDSTKPEEDKSSKESEGILRLKKDIQSFQQWKQNNKKQLNNVTLEFPDPQHINPLHIVIKPLDGLYKNTRLTFIYDIRDNYPYKSPVVECKQRVFHPNIDPQNRAVCLSILKEGWLANNQLLEVVYGIVQILESLRAQDTWKPLDARAAQLFKQDPEKFKQILTKTLKGQSFEGRQFDNVWVN